MPRVKRGTAAHRRHKKIFTMTKGFRGKRKNVFKLAKNAAMKAGQNAYRDRRLKKRTFHQLWILRINAACRNHDIKYSRFIYGLELAGIRINRKMLAELAVNNPEIFTEIVDQAKKALPPEGKAPNLEDLKKKFGVNTAKKTEVKEEMKESPLTPNETTENNEEKKAPSAKKPTVKKTTAKP